jgi:hypothetical protein
VDQNIRKRFELRKNLQKSTFFCFGYPVIIFKLETGVYRRPVSTCVHQDTTTDYQKLPKFI